MPRPRLPALTLALSLVSGSAAGDEARFIPLGDLPGGVFQSGASAISADGMQVFGGGFASSGAVPFRWTEASGMVALEALPGAIHDVSDDGTVIVGIGKRPGPFQNLMAYRWTESGGLAFLGDLPGGASLSEALGVSSDGSVAVG